MTVIIFLVLLVPFDVLIVLESEHLQDFFHGLKYDQHFVFLKLYQEVFMIRNKHVGNFFSGLMAAMAGTVGAIILIPFSMAILVSINYVSLVLKKMW